MADVTVKANSPDWWGEVPSVPTGLTEDRYVAAIEIKEVNDAKPSSDGRHTVGGRYVVHHMIWGTRVPDAPPDLLGSRSGPFTKWDGIPTTSIPIRAA